MIRNKNYKTFKHNLGENLCDFGLHNDLLNKIPKAQSRKVKENVDKSTSSKIRTVRPSLVVYACNPSYSDGDQEDHGLKPAYRKIKTLSKT
jgi:hypothetical protein